MRNSLPLTQLTHQHLTHLCQTIGSRSTGSPGNTAASQYIAGVFRAAGLDTLTPAFDCLDWAGGSARLAVGAQTFPIFPGPFSPAFSGAARLVCVSTLAALLACDPGGKILLIHGALAAEPLMPRHYPFYYPYEHEQIYAALAARPPLALVTATPPGTFLSGGLYPCPMIEDGSFPLPSAYMDAQFGAGLAACDGQEACLQINSHVSPATACNVIGRPPGTGSAKMPGRVVICAHLDTKPTTAGALDNASGVVTLLLLARLFQAAPPTLPVELVALNGEDYYSAAGQINYITSTGLDGIRLVINVDGAAFVHGQTAWSLYEVDEQVTEKTHRAFADFPNSLEGEPWYAGDHTMFVQNRIPALAVTSQEGPHAPLSFLQVIHTQDDLPELVDPAQLGHLAQAIYRLVRSLGNP